MNVIDGIPINYLFYRIKVYKESGDYTIYPANWMRKYAWKLITDRKNIKWKAIIKLYVGRYTYTHGYYYFKGDKFIKFTSDRCFEPIPPEWIIESMKGIRDRFFRERHIKVFGIPTENNPIEPYESIPYVIIVDRKKKIAKVLGYYRTSNEVLNNGLNDVCECSCCGVDCKYRGKGYTIPPCSDIYPEALLKSEYKDYKIVF